MDKILHPITITSESVYPESSDSVSKRQWWHMRIKQLLLEAETAKSRGQWKKAQALLFEVSKITRNYYDKII
jgi:hypothetical protein